MTKCSRKIGLDRETADQITVAVLKDYRKYLKSQLKKHLANPELHWMHPEDVADSTKVIAALKLVINHY
jgi:hypothetical protein